MSQSPGRDSANILLLARRGLALGRGGCNSRRLEPAGWGSGSLGVQTRACDAGECVRRLAACVPLPGSSAHVSRCSGLRDHCPPSTPRRSGSGEWARGRAEDFAGLAAPQLFPLMAAMTPLTLCAPGGPAPARGSAAQPGEAAARRLALRCPSGEQQHPAFSDVIFPLVD